MGQPLVQSLPVSLTWSNGQKSAAVTLFVDADVLLAHAAMEM
jgi:hypothetical protein